MKLHFPSLRPVRPVALLAGLMLVSGCETLTRLPLFGEKYPVADARHPVLEVVGIWQPGEGRGTNGLPCRGFAGQLLFVTIGNPRPAKVNGSLRIYVFDDSGTLDEQSEPMEVFDFTPEEWSALARPTNLGMAYQLLVPYQRPGRDEANCAIRVRFTPVDGGSPVYSELTPITLPGKKVKRESLASGRDANGAAPVLNPQVQAALDDLALRLKDDAARTIHDPPPRSFEPSFALPIKQAGSSPPSIERLEAVLDHADQRTVERATYSEPAGQNAAPRRTVRSPGLHPALQAANGPSAQGPQ